MRLKTLWTSLAGTAILLSAVGFSPKPAPDFQKTIAGYRAWRKLTKKPVHMAPMIAQLCRGPMPWNAGNNPHESRWFSVFINRPGEKRIDNLALDKFPVGTVIVKEKLRSISDSAPELLTAMVKREPGFDAKNGDWDFFVSDAKGKFSQENKAACQSCHQMRAKNDFVFQNYGPGNEP